MHFSKLYNLHHFLINVLARISALWLVNFHLLTSVLLVRLQNCGKQLLTLSCLSVCLSLSVRLSVCQSICQYNTAHALCVPGNRQECSLTPTVFVTFFVTATVFMRKRFSIMWYVHYLSSFMGISYLTSVWFMPTFFGTQLVHKTMSVCGFLLEPNILLCRGFGNFNVIM